MRATRVPPPRPGRFLDRAGGPSLTKPDLIAGGSAPPPVSADLLARRSARDVARTNFRPPGTDERAAVFRQEPLLRTWQLTVPPMADILWRLRADIRRLLIESRLLAIALEDGISPVFRRLLICEFGW